MTRSLVRPLAGVAAVLFLAAACAQDDAPEADRAGDEIAFSVNRRGWNEIWVMSSDGTHRRRLTEREPAQSDAAGSMAPAWSPDGRQIAFAAQIGAREEDQSATEIYVMRADGTGKRRLTRNEALDGTPTWSPDGRRIAFTRITDPGTVNARSGIFVLDVGGSGEVQVTRAAFPTFDGLPAWSPDGSVIAFTRSSARGLGSATPELRVGTYAVTPEGRALTKLTDDAAEPAWSPDGRRLAFTSIRDGFGRTCFHECGTSSEIYVLELESGEVARLTRSKADDGSPAWSPDGSSIAFSSDRSNPQAHEYELYVMTPSGEDVRRLTRNDVWDREPAWRP